jgi:hypothetical protein
MAAAVSPEVLSGLSAAFNLLGGNEAESLAKRRSQLRVDFLIEPSTIVELDEFQHFTSARLQTLDFYEGLDHGLDLSTYRRLCKRHGAAADRYRAAKPAAGFNFYGGRSAQRAYLDMCRDLLAPAFGERVIRIAAPTSSVEAAVYDLKRALASG